MKPLNNMTTQTINLQYKSKGDIFYGVNKKKNKMIKRKIRINRKKAKNKYPVKNKLLLILKANL
jgi:hypothetical protein